MAVARTGTSDLGRRLSGCWRLWVRPKGFRWAPSFLARTRPSRGPEEASARAAWQFHKNSLPGLFWEFCSPGEMGSTDLMGMEGEREKSICSSLRGWKGERVRVLALLRARGANVCFLPAPIFGGQRGEGAFLPVYIEVAFSRSRVVSGMVAAPKVRPYPTPSRDCDRTWGKDLCRSHEGKDLKMRPSWIT